MDTTTKIIVAALTALFAACAAIVYIVTRETTIALVFTGLATSGATGLFALLYGARLSAPITGELLEAPGLLEQTAPLPPASVPTPGTNVPTASTPV